MVNTFSAEAWYTAISSHEIGEDFCSPLDAKMKAEATTDHLPPQDLIERKLFGDADNSPLLNSGEE